ncbi:MAG TPA: response regulator [Casimicrobiaceae bacterium]|nr:response regulator [Casimicrobiaceae bacterium]
MPTRVYVVEDSQLVFERLQESMEEVGAKVVGHADAASTAVAQIGELRPDAVVVDIALREGTGLHVLKEIEQLPEDGRPVRIVLTNFNRPWYRDAAKRLGAEYFFDKSCDVSRMLDVLRSMVLGRRAPRHAHAHV